MDVDKKIFRSDITRVNLKEKNDLQELICITPATPIPVKVHENDTPVFEPKCEKHYAPKNKSRLKVRTVRDIRNLFEHDNYRFIVEDVEKQQNTLLSKIRTGSSSDFNTKNLAKKLFEADYPISRTTWQMISNVNPDKNTNPIQFVLWNGGRIRVVGSKGGKNKFISNYDLEKKDKKVIERKSNIKKCTKKHGLLRNSLNIKFKPGPLGRKRNLDVSHQKYHMGPIELVKLPKPALDVQPAFGKVVEPIMANFLNKLRAEDGTISEKWAEFSVSVVGTVKDNNLIQKDPESCITFDLTYKCAQNRILMRRDICNVNANYAIATKNIHQNGPNSNSEIKNILDNILDSVEISLKQDSIYSTEKESPRTTPERLDENNINFGKDKSKKKYGELGRLDVTVIQLPGTPKMDVSKPCGKAYCSMGCLCDSLNCTYKFKQHCGNSECMFGCKCEVSKFKDIELLENGCEDLIPGLMNLDSEINANLAKEEQKFHQTVVFSGEKSILLKHRKRNAKISKKYEDFFTNLRSKNEEQKKIVTVVAKKFNCSNIEPWCMVHNLYRCFCKGRFTESSALNSTNSMPTSNIPTVNLTNSDDEPSLENTVVKIETRKDSRLRMRKSEIINKSSVRKDGYLLESYLKDYNNDATSARVNIYAGRKYTDGYYKVTNKKIKEMEKNDVTLQKKMQRLMKEPTTKPTVPETPDTQSNVQVEEVIGEFEIYDNKPNDKNHMGPSIKQLPGNDTRFFKTIAEKFGLSNNTEQAKTKPSEHNIPFEISGDIYKPIKGKKITQDILTPWITKSYKNYKEQLNSGKSTLERPKKGRIILHLWECLLNRYRNRRNVFLTTTKRPFRIYIATDITKPFFKDCINIDSIRFADLHNYPCVVKKLLTNATHKDYFCILGGWDDCWEVIGSVKKNDNVNDDSNTESSCNDSDFAPSENWCVNEQDAYSSDIDFTQDNKKALELETIERSKWFIMKLQNDFTDIHCHKKGFYVEYEKLTHAINLARLTHKTVVINKQSSTETENIPFGIYALPIKTEYWAVVGPYEMEEPLGLEILKSKSVSIQKSTKGFWLTTNKVDNIKLLDDPMSFLPKPAQTTFYNSISKNKVSGDDQPKRKTSGENSRSEHILNKDQNIKTIPESANIETASKLVRPIKIRRTNGFYHLTSNNNDLFKNLLTLPSTSNSILNEKCLETNDSTSDSPGQKYPDANVNDNEINKTDAILAHVESEPEASHIKITSVYSENVQEIAKKNEKVGMFILKPEEINKKITELNDHKINSEDDEEMYMDMAINNFLSPPKANTIVEDDDCLVISDDEDDITANSAPQKWTDVWIQCSNINNLGWIRGKRNTDNLLKIDFPGFETTKLYTDTEAMEKINEIMSERITIPEQVKLKWQVLKASKNSKSGKPLLMNDKKTPTNSINTDGSRNYKLRIRRKTTAQKSNTSKAKATLLEDPPAKDDTVLNGNSELFKGLEQTSRLLEDKNVLLWIEAEKKQSDLIQKFSVPEESRREMSATLQGLMSMNDDLNHGSDND